MELLFSTAGSRFGDRVLHRVPLDFSLLVGPWLNTLLRVVMIVGIGGAAIGVIVWLVRFIAGRDYSAARAA